MNEYKVFVKSWVTDENKFNNPLPFRTMFGKVIKQTRKAYQLELYGKPIPSSKCFSCNRKLTHPVSLLYGLGPICGQHYHILPLEDESNLERYMTEITSVLKEVKWKGWLPKSAIKEISLAGNPKRYKVEFLYNKQIYRTFTTEEKLEEIYERAQKVHYVIDIMEEAI